MFTIANNRRTVLTFGASNGSESRIAHRFRGQNGVVGMITTRRIGVGIALALALGAVAAPASARTFNYSSAGSMVQQPPPTGARFRWRGDALGGGRRRWIRVRGYPNPEHCLGPADSAHGQGVAARPVRTGGTASDRIRATERTRIQRCGDQRIQDRRHPQPWWQWPRRRLGLTGATRASAPPPVSRSRCSASAQRS